MIAVKTSLTLALALILAGSSLAAPAHERLLLRSVRVFDPASGTVGPPRDLRIENGVVGLKERVRRSGLYPVRVIDCSGKTALPGLFDCHTHLAHLFPSGEDSLRRALSGFVHRGVLYTRDVGGPIDLLSGLERRIESGEVCGPKIFYAGPMLEASPLTWGKFNRELPGFTVAVDSVATVDSLLPALASQAATIIKTFNQFNPEVYRHLCNVARRCRLRIVHDPGMPLFQDIPMDEALDLGVRCFEHAKSPWPVVLRDDLRRMHDAARRPGAGMAEHMQVMTRAVDLGADGISVERLRWLGGRMADRGAFLCPTLAVFRTMADLDKDPATDEEIPEAQKMMMKKVMAAMEEVSRLCVRELEGSGVRMLTGQDGCDPAATVREMGLMKECGVPEVEILRGSTLYPALFLGVADRIGRISEGRSADLVIVNGNPLEEIGAMGSVFLVVQRGRVVRS